LFLTVLSYSVSGCSNFDTAFLPDCIKFCSIFPGLDRKFSGDLKNVLKTVVFLLQVQAILSLTVLLNCVSGSSNFDTAFLPDCTNISGVFQVLDRKFNEDSKNVLKTVIFVLQVGFSGDFVYASFQTVFLSVQTLTSLFSLTVSNFVVFFHVWIGNLVRI